MNEGIEENEEYLTAKEAAASLGITESAFYNATYQHGLARKQCNGRWCYAKSVIEGYRKIRGAKKQTTPLQSEETQPAPSTIYLIDPLKAFPYGPYEVAKSIPSEVEASEVESVEAATPELNEEDAFLRSIMAQMRRQAAREQQWRAERVVDQLRGIRVTVVGLLDALIAEYETSEDETPSR